MQNDQHTGYLAAPKTGSGKPVLVLHAWWGLNETIKQCCERLAGAGFVSFAPDLFKGQVAATIPEAEALTKALVAEEANQQIEKAVQTLKQNATEPWGGLAVIGFSLGAYFALDLSVTDAENVHSVVVFYGTGRGDFNGSKAAYLGHFAEDDPFEPQSEIDALEAGVQQANLPVNIYHYPGTGHWFFEPDRSDAFVQDAAELAWARTLAFLNRTR